MTAPFPHRYHVTVGGAGGGGAVVSATPRPSFRGGPPAEFNGRDDWWSPEHLLLAATGLCLKSTFDALTARAGVPVLGYSSRVGGVLEKAPRGIVFTSITIAVELMVAEHHVARARELLLQAKEHCIVAKSLAVPINLVSSVRVAAAATA